MAQAKNETIRELKKIMSKVPAKDREAFIYLVGAGLRQRKPELFAANLETWNRARALMLA